MPAVRPRLVLAAVPVLAYLALMLLVAVYVDPPLLGWIGFAVVGVVALAAGAAAAALFPRMSVNAEPAPAQPGADGVLVLADARCSSAALCGELAPRLRERRLPVHVVAPVLASPLHFLTDDEGGERADARVRLTETLDDLRRSGIDATGSLGADEPLQALGDALATFPAREVVIVTARASHWLEDALPERARELVPRVESVVASEPVVTV